MTTALGTVANWYANQLSELGLLAVLNIQAAAIVALICGTGAALKARNRRRADRATTQAAQDGIRVAENYANYDSVRQAVDTNYQPRKENRP